MTDVTQTEMVTEAAASLPVRMASCAGSTRWAASEGWS